MDYLTGGLWDVSYYGNTLGDYTQAFITFAVLVAILAVVKRFAVSRFVKTVERSETSVDNAVLAVFQTIHPPFYIFISFYIATRFLAVTGWPGRALEIVLIIWVTWQVISAIQIFLDQIIQRKLATAEDASRKAASGIIGGIAKIALWLVGGLFILSNLGVNITSLIAGLGIGGLAFALAAQKILEDLFSSLAIFFDKPFAPGDYIVIGKDSGTVQKVGIKTTRIKSLSGEEIVVPNKDITSSRVKNFKRMNERRIAFNIGVTYDTPQEKMKMVPGMIQQIIESQEHTKFDRCHFIDFGDSALIFETVYHLDGREYDLYVDTHHEVLMAMKEKFEQEGIEIAYPTQTIFTKSLDSKN